MKYPNHIKAWRKKAELSQLELADRVGLYKGYISELERGLKQTNQDLLIRLGTALGATPAQLLGTNPEIEAETEHNMPIRFRTGGGAWIERDDYTDDFLGTLNVGKFERYNNYPQWIEQLEGDSMNRILPSGSYLQVVDTAAMGYMPRQDDIVIIERSRDGGFLRERSAKQVNINESSIEFWPRSDSPRWQKPIIFHEHTDDETVTVSIVGLVVRGIMNLL